MILTDKEEIGMAASLLQEISQDERERARLRSQRMYEADRISDLLTAEENGATGGRTEGISIPSLFVVLFALFSMNTP
ncbi:MAG: hypothetical protein FWC06_01780 [Treponema sp.]|nr:hypothetical protein [Treponema sp.]